MQKLIFPAIIAFAIIGCASVDNEYYQLLSVSKPDVIVTNRVEYTRRGTLGTQDYVVTDVKIDTTLTDISETAKSKGNGFVDKYGEDQNVAVEIGKGSKAAVTSKAIDSAPSNTVGRSASVAIGAYSDATTGDDSTKNQAIAIGFHSQAKASNAISIGSGAQHPDETAVTGDATVASASEAIAMGYRAKSNASRAVQIGDGVNNNTATLQFRSYTLLDASGQIPSNRLDSIINSITPVTTDIVSKIDRIYQPGNMTVISNNSDEQYVEPRLQGLSELIFIPNTNGIYESGSEVSCMPPNKSRNYDILVNEIPQFVSYSNSIEVVNGVTNTIKTVYDIPPENNFCIDFYEISTNTILTLRCDPSYGYTNKVSICITNAPCLIKVREPATNKLYCVVKPWNIAEDL